MRVQAVSTERASAYRDAGPSDVRRAEAVSTTAVANAGEKSYPWYRRHARDAAHEKGVVPGSWSLGSDTLRVRRRRGGRGSSRCSRRN